MLYNNLKKKVVLILVMKKLVYKELEKLLKKLKQNYQRCIKVK